MPARTPSMSGTAHRSSAGLAILHSYRVVETSNHWNLSHPNNTLCLRRLGCTVENTVKRSNFLFGEGWTPSFFAWGAMKMWSTVSSVWNWLQMLRMYVCQLHQVKILRIKIVRSIEESGGVKDEIWIRKEVVDDTGVDNLWHSYGCITAFNTLFNVLNDANWRFVPDFCRKCKQNEANDESKVTSCCLFVLRYVGVLFWYWSMAVWKHWQTWSRHWHAAHDAWDPQVERQRIPSRRNHLSPFDQSAYASMPANMRLASKICKNLNRFTTFRISSHFLQKFPSLIPGQRLDYSVRYWTKRKNVLCFFARLRRASMQLQRYERFASGCVLRCRVKHWCCTNRSGSGRLRW
jgi:hypothetical protein